MQILKRYIYVHVVDIFTHYTVRYGSYIPYIIMVVIESSTLSIMINICNICPQKIWLHQNLRSLEINRGKLNAKRNRRAR